VDGCKPPPWLMMVGAEASCEALSALAMEAAAAAAATAPDCPLGLAAQVEFESKCEAKFKAVYNILVSSASSRRFQHEFYRGNLHCPTSAPPPCSPQVMACQILLATS
jgi:hypothetical protein